MGETTSNYIGEAADLRRRFAGYRRGHACQRTNARLNVRMREHLEAGGRVEVAIAEEVEVTINGQSTGLDLGRKASRLLAESAALHLVPDAEPLENLPGVGDASFMRDEPSPQPVGDQLRGLAAFLQLFEASDFTFGEWEAPKAQPNGVIAMGFYAHSPAAIKFIEELYNLGVVPFKRNWVKWQHTPEAQALQEDRDYLAQATPLQLFELLTLLVRGDRFSEGVLGNAFESGLLTAILARADSLAKRL